MLRLRSLFVSLTFVAVIGGGAIAQLVPADRGQSLDENRPRTAFPRLHVPGRTLPLLARAIDRWFSDNFQLRTPLIRATSTVRNVWLHTSSSSLVMFGQDGWLYYTGDSSLWFARKANPFTRSEVSRVADAVEQRSRALAERHISYLLMIAPDPATIYPEHQPQWLRQLAPGPSRFDQLVALTDARQSFVVVDPRGLLLAARASSPELLYRPTDTHWNNRGAYIGYRALLLAMARATSSSSPLAIPAPLPVDSFAVATIDTIGGDMAALLLRAASYHERLDVLTPQHSRLAEPILPGQRMRPDFTTSWRDAGRGPRVLVFRDSYFSAMQPFFSESFPRVRYVLGPYRESVVLEEKADIVVEEMVERYLGVARFVPQP